MKRRKSYKKIIWEGAPDVKKRIRDLEKALEIDFIPINKIYCFRSFNSKSNSYARIWGLSRIWQLALDIKPCYIIEVISEKFDTLNLKQKDKVLIHELAHIPKNFSGSLLPHTKRGKNIFQNKVNNFYFKLKKSK